MTKEDLIRAFNALDIPDMPEVTELYALPGSYVNLEYTFASGQKAKLWDDGRTYWGAELCRPGQERCYGLTTDGKLLLVCEYGEAGADPEIVVLKRMNHQ